MTTFTPCDHCPSATACHRWGYCNAEAMRDGEGKTAAQVMEAREAKCKAGQFTREDFEHAARAAGIELIRWLGDCFLAVRMNDPLYGNVQCVWAPPKDDGDALRLAVALGLNVEVRRKVVAGCSVPHVEVYGYVHRRSLAVETAIDNGLSLEVATRHAIFRAAIAVGKAMP